MLSVLKLSLPLNQQYLKIDLNNLQEPNWDEVTEEQKLDVDEFSTIHIYLTPPLGQDMTQGQFLSEV